MIRNEAQHLRAIVDMGSNGIRFSISSLQPPTARIMPTVYQHRAGISLYDAQYSASGERQSIDEQTISAVVTVFKQFQRTCSDFAVPEKHVTVLATEATRTALNSEDFRARIKQATGWEVTMLAKEDEGRIGGMGIASSLPEVTGLVMDLGGGSTQLSWLISKEGKGVQMPETGSISMPFGAAAMSRRLAEAEKAGKKAELETEVKNAVKEAFAKLEVPKELERAAKEQGGFTLYLSGGGFRGWGYVLMNQHQVKPYPIPVINGFRAAEKDFKGTREIQSAAAAALEHEDDEIFRVSDRRASQVPAVAFLINALVEVLPQIKHVRFCQGGVREGYLFKSLDAEVQAQHPLVVATQPFSPTSSKPILALLTNAFPPGSTSGAQYNYKSVFTPDLLEAFAQLMYYHSSHSKDLQASSALRSTTSGILAGVHGILHESRTLLALLLCARWGGEVPPTDDSFKKSLEQLVELPWTLWWIQYIGSVAALIAAVHPAGVSKKASDRLRLSATWDRSGKGASLLSLRVLFGADFDQGMFVKEIKNIEKVGKKRNWVGGADGVGHKVAVEMELRHETN